MDDLTEVYNELIMEHSMNSYNKKKLENADTKTKLEKINDFFNIFYLVNYFYKSVIICINIC